MTGRDARQRQRRRRCSRRRLVALHAARVVISINRRQVSALPNVAGFDCCCCCCCDSRKSHLPSTKHNCAGDATKAQKCSPALSETANSDDGREIISPVWWNLISVFKIQQRRRGRRPPIKSLACPSRRRRRSKLPHLHVTGGACSQTRLMPRRQVIHLRRRPRRRPRRRLRRRPSRRANQTDRQTHRHAQGPPECAKSARAGATRAGRGSSHCELLAGPVRWLRGTSFALSQMMLIMTSKINKLNEQKHQTLLAKEALLSHTKSAPLLLARQTIQADEFDSRYLWMEAI